MKVSKREKLLLILLSFLIVGIVYYNYIYVKQSTKLEELKAQEAEVNSTYQSMVEKVNTIEKNRTNIKIYRESISAKSMLLYPELYQDKIILEVNKLLNDAGIKGSLSFSEVTVSTVGKYFSEDATEKTEESLQQPADQIHEINGATSSKDEEASSEGDTTTAEENASESLVEQMKVSVSFSGTYANTTKFIKSVSEYARLVAMPTISLSNSGEDLVSGSLELEFYSIPKISEEDSEYLKWNLEDTYGKENPFLEGEASGTILSSSEENEYDIIMAVKGSDSDLPSVTLGKANDTTRETYIYYDENEKVDIEIEINEEEGRYFVKYKTSDSSYPSNYEDRGIEVNPGDGKIQIAVQSSIRSGIDDKVSVNLKVSGNTNGKMTLVTIKGDDMVSPRINIDAKGKVEYVIKQ